MLIFDEKEVLQTFAIHFKHPNMFIVQLRDKTDHIVYEALLKIFFQL